MVSNKEEKSNEEDEKEVSNTKQKSNKNNGALVEIDHQNVEELEPSEKEDVILE